MQVFTRQQCLILSQAFSFWCGSAQLSKKTDTVSASLGLNTSDPKAVQLDPAMNLDQSQGQLTWYCGREQLTGVNAVLH